MLARMYRIAGQHSQYNIILSAFWLSTVCSLLHELQKETNLRTTGNVERDGIGRFDLDQTIPVDPALVDNVEPDRIRWFESGLEQLGHSIMHSFIVAKSESIGRALERLPLSTMTPVGYSDLLMYVSSTSTSCHPTDNCTDTNNVVCFVPQG
jgi:hypothetical protein